MKQHIAQQPKAHEAARLANKKAPAIQADHAKAVILLPDAQNVVVLPAGVTLDDLQVQGRDLVIQLADGRAFIIPDGAVFVPQIVVDGVAVPPLNLAALLNSDEIQPAAGVIPSSGGNFADPPAPIQDAFELGNLLPYTELVFPEGPVQEVLSAVDREPTAGAIAATLDDDALAGGIAGGTGDVSPDTSNLSGNLPGEGGDGQLTFALSASGAPAGFTYETSSANTLLIKQAGVTVITVTVNPVFGAYTITQNVPVTHASGANENNQTFAITYTVTDADGDVAPGTIAITVNDDSTTAAVSGQAIPTLVLDESASTTDTAGASSPAGRSTITANFATNFVTPAYGADGAGSTSYALVLNGSNVASGLYALDSSDKSSGDGDGYGQGAQILLNQSGNTITGSVGGVDYFTITIDPATGIVTFTQLKNIWHPNAGLSATALDDSAALSTALASDIKVQQTVTDKDGDSATAAVNVGQNVFAIQDDGPKGNDDIDTVASGTTGPATGNVLTGVEVAVSEDPNATDGIADSVGTDGGIRVTFIDNAKDAAAGAAVTDGGFTDIAGLYGTLRIWSNGDYQYTRTPQRGGGQTEEFNYTVIDGDEDTVLAKLNITIADAVPVITNLTPRANGGDVTVDEDDLSDGSDTSKESLTQQGDFTVTSPDGIDSLVIDGRTVISNGVFTATSWTTPLGNTISITGYNAATGVVTYTYRLIDNENHAAGNGENAIFESFSITVTDLDGDTATGTLDARIIDDVPTARNDTDSVTGGASTATGNVISGVDIAGGDPNSTDGVVDTRGADGASLTRIASNNVPANVDSTADGSGNLQVAGQYGSLTINQNGNYTYTRNSTAGGGGTDVFTYTLTDGDGDLTNATLTISIGDARPSVDAPDTGEAGTTVYEKGLPARGAGPEPAGTGEAADGNSADNDDTSETVTGTITFDPGDPPPVVEIDGVAVTGTVGQTFNGSHGVLTITSYNAAGTIGYSYTLSDNTSGNATSDDFLIEVTDADSDTASDTLVISIVDDAPIATDDTDSIAAGSSGPATGNVITDAEGDGGKDNVGADNAVVAGVAAGDTNANLDSAATVGAVIQGTYGKLTLNANGSYSYTRDAGTQGGVTDTFTYTLKDGDGDLTNATLTISIGDARPSVDAPDTGEAGTTVYEKGLPARGAGPEPAGTGEAADGNSADNDDTSETVTGTITFDPGDPPPVVEIDGVAVTGTVGQTFNGSHGVLTITSYNAAGTIGYSYTLSDNTSGNATSDDFLIEVTDADSDTASDTLVISIVDDAPIATDDTDSIAAGSSGPATGNVITDAEGDGGKDNVGADNAVVAGVAAGDTNANLDSAATVGAVIQGTYGKLTLNANGSYSYTRDAGTQGGVTDTFTYTLKDGDGDLTNATLTISIGDARPSVDAPDTGEAGTTVYEKGLPARGAGPEPAGTGEAADGNSADNDDTSETVTGTITFDPGDPPPVVEIDGVAVTGTVGQTFNGSHGVLTITSYNAAGTIGYSYTLSDNTSGNATSDDFLIEVTDADSDTASDTLVISIVDDAPIATDDTDSIAAGSSGPATGNVITDAEGDGGKDNVGADNAVVAGVAAGDTNANLDSAATVGAVIQGTYGKLTLNANGSYSYTRDAGTQGGVTDTFTYTLKDGDGDLTNATLTISIGDAVPTLATPTAVQLDDDALTGGNPSGTGDNADSSGTPGSLSGSGGDGDLDYYFSATQDGLPAGFTVDPTSTATTLKILQGTTLVLTVTLNNETGAYSVTQNTPVVHPAGNDENNIPNINVKFYTQDVDGSQSAPAILSINVDDDTPVDFSPVDLTDRTGSTATTQDNALVNDGNAVVTRLINDANNDGTGENFIGADGYGSLIFSGATDGSQLLSDSGTPLRSGGSQIYLYGFGTGTLIASTDTNATDGLDSTKIVFTATLSNGAGYGSASTYTIDFNKTVDDGSGVVLSDFSKAPPGQNDWIGIDKDLNDIDADNNNSTDLLITGTAGTINTSSTDIGSNNQWVDSGEVIRIDFVVDVARDGANDEKDVQGYTFDNHYAVTNSSFKVVQTQGGGTAAVRVRTKLDSDSGNIKDLTGSNISILSSSIVVTNNVNPATGFTIVDMGDGSFVIYGLEAGDIVSFGTNGVNFNAVEISNAAGVANPNGGTFIGDNFSLGAFGYETARSGNPIDLTFNVTATDSDGDTSTGTIDVTLVPAAVIPPVVLDLDGDGTEFLPMAAGVTFDYNGDGISERTAWAGKDDGILAIDLDGNGKITRADEFVFGGDGLTDLEGLAAKYDTNHDGILDAKDNDFAKFGVWQDANSNGVNDTGEFHSLSELGITSINLTSDGKSYVAAEGDVTVSGETSFTWAEGSQGEAADASFNVSNSTTADNATSLMDGQIGSDPVATSTAPATTDGSTVQTDGSQTGGGIQEATSLSVVTESLHEGAASNFIETLLNNLGATSGTINGGANDSEAGSADIQAMLAVEVGSDHSGMTMTLAPTLDEAHAMAAA